MLMNCKHNPLLSVFRTLLRQDNYSRVRFQRLHITLFRAPFAQFHCIFYSNAVGPSKYTANSNDAVDDIHTVSRVSFAGTSIAECHSVSLSKFNSNIKAGGKSSAPVIKLLENELEKSTEYTGYSSKPCVGQSYEINRAELEVLVTTCSEMWDDQPDGASFLVKYIDTALPSAQSHSKSVYKLSSYLGRMSAHSKLSKDQPITEDSDCASTVTNSVDTVSMHQRESVNRIKIDGTTIQEEYDDCIEISRPIALVIEGSDGTDLEPLVKELVGRGFRVVLPRLVGSGGTRAVSETEGERYEHTLGERAAFIIDFIASIGLHRIDVVVAHTNGCLPVLALAANAQQNIFRSVVFLSPRLESQPPSWLKPVSLSYRLIDWTHKPLLLPLQWLWLHCWLKFRLPDLSIKHKVPPTLPALTQTIRLLTEIALGINYNVLQSFADVYRLHAVPLLFIKPLSTIELSHFSGQTLNEVESTLLGLNYSVASANSSCDISDNTGHQAPTEVRSRPANKSYGRLVLVDSQVNYTESVDTRTRLVDEIVEMYHQIK